MMYNPVSTRRDRHGFTLLEVLVAMGIFAVGFATLAAIFPAAALMQKQTIDDNISQQLSRSSQAVLRAVASDISEYLDEQSPSPDQVVALLEEVTLSSKDRSFPSTLEDENARRYFWIPLGMRTTDGEERTYTFVVRCGSGVNYPRHGDDDLWANPGDGLIDPFTEGNPTPTPNFRVPGVYKAGVQVADWDRLQIPDQESDFTVRYDLSASHLGPGDWIVDEGGTLYQIVDVPADRLIVLNAPIVGDPSYIWCVPRGEHSNGTIRRTSPVIRVDIQTIKEAP